MKQQENILDDFLPGSPSNLSDVQLISFLAEKTSFPPHILDAVQAEIYRRRLSPNEQNTLVANYKNDTYPILFKIPNAYFFWGVLLLILSGFSIGRGLVILLSLIALYVQFKKGKKASSKFWLGSGLCLFGISLILILLISILKYL